MKLHTSQGFRGQVIDLDTGLPVRKVIWVDLEAGELEAFDVDKSGDIKTRIIDGQIAHLTYRAKGRFRFIPANQAMLDNAVRRAAAKIGAKECAKCKSPLTLPADELCPSCRAKANGQKNLMQAERLPSLKVKRGCQHKGCNNPAEWIVADEVEVSPQLHRKILYERGATVGRRFYCSSHYRPPRILDPKGEVVTEIEDAGGVRPE